MIGTCRIRLLFIFILFPFHLTAQVLPPPSPVGPCLGQEAPGKEPEIFAPGLVSETGERLHGPLTISPDGKVICWSVIPPAIRYRFQRDDGSWSGTLTIPLQVKRLTAAQFAPDGRLWFQGVPEDGSGGVDLGFVTWNGRAWSGPRWPGPAVNSDTMDSNPTATLAGDLYLTGGRPGKIWNRGIYHLPFKDGYFQSRVYLPPPVNEGDGCIDYTPFIAPDGSYLIWSSSRPTDVESDLKLYISYRTPAGAWAQPLNLSEKLGLDHAARFPAVSPDGHYLFFLMENRIWWVDAGVLAVENR